LIFDTVDGGSFNEVTLAANRNDLRRIEFRQRVLRDVSTPNLSTTVLGQEIAMPLVLAPVGFAGLFAPRAEVQAACAAERAGIPFCEATLAICSIEEVAASVDQPAWFQLYVIKDRAYTQDLMARAQAAGCTTLILTVDLPVFGLRYREIRDGARGGLSIAQRLRRDSHLLSRSRWIRQVALGGRPLTPGNFEKALPHARKLDDFYLWLSAQYDSTVTWDDLAWIRENWRGKIALKGILDPDDARNAVAQGADAVIVSNHGGRQLDQVPSSIRSLPAIVEAVGGECEVLMDGGIRSGLDVVKALSLGARACLIGRPWVYAVAARGERGLDHILRIFREEMLVALGLTGVADVGNLDSTVLVEP
jgi:L-lactate dehydrogenase (cytochrome)